MDRAVLYTDFLEELRKVGLSVREFAELVGMNPNSISNYARAGELPTHIALIAVLVVGVSQLGGDYRLVMSRVERVRKKPRGAGRRGRFGGAKQSERMQRYATSASASAGAAGGSEADG